MKINFSKRELDIIRELLFYSTETVTNDYLLVFNRRLGRNMRVTDEEVFKIGEKINEELKKGGGRNE